MIKKILLKNIKLEENSRTNYGNLASLMSSIRQDGLMQPVGVRDLGDEGYKLLFGFRRYFSIKKLGWDEIEARIYEKDEDFGSESDDIIINLNENFHRESVTEFEKGRAINKLIEDHGLTKKEVAARLAVDVKNVNSMLNIFNDTPKEFRKDVVYITPGKSSKENKAGKIGASLAERINNCCKRNSLPVETKKELYKKAKNCEIGINDIRKIERELKSGGDYQTVIEKTNEVRIINFRLELRNEDYEHIFKLGNPSEIVRELIYGERKIRKKILRPL